MSVFRERFVGRNLHAQVTTAAIAFGVVVGVLSVVTLGSIHWMLERSQVALARDAEHCRMADSVAMDAFRSQRDAETIFHRLDAPQLRKQCLTDWVESTAGLEATLAEFEQTAVTDAERSLVHRCRELHLAYRQGFIEAVRAIESGEIRSQTEANAAAAAFKPYIADLTVRAEQIGGLNIDELSSEMSTMASRMSTSAVVLCILLTSIIVSVIVFKSWFKRSILARVETLHQAVSRFADGDLDSRAPVGTLDELGLIAAQFNTMARNQQSQHEDLRQAKEAADQSNHAKDEFLANISHELRTPLHGILSYARFGVDEVETSDRGELQHYFSTIGKCSQGLLSLVNDLLDMAKLEAGRMQICFQSGSMVPLVAVVVDEFESLCSERDIRIRLLEPYDDIDMNLDSERIKQVLRNLLANAVRFSPPRSEVTVTALHHAGRMCVRVCDQGPGIPPGELEAIFDKFVQSSKTKSGSGGTGLGLAICRQIVSAHRGRIWAENGPSGGAVMTFEIPIDLEATSEAETLLASEASAE